MSASDPKIDRITLIHMDGKIYARCYNDRDYTDAVISVGCLVNVISDGAKILSSVYQDMASRITDARL